MTNRKKARNLKVPFPISSRPQHVRSTSTSSIPPTHEALLPPDSPSFSFNPNNTPTSPPSRPDVPPNTAQAMSGMVTPVTEQQVFAPLAPSASMTTLLAGETGKAFKIHTDLLTSRSPYFRDMLGAPTRRSSIVAAAPLEDPETPIPESDTTIPLPNHSEFAISLLTRWLYGASLPGPTHAQHIPHYLSLYILSSSFLIERLENETMDCIRAYYRATDAPIPPWRLEYVFKNTGAQRGGMLRGFLCACVAQRAVREGWMGGEALREVLAKGGELALGVVDALVEESGGGVGDVREGPDCRWHRHEETRVCGFGSGQEGVREGW